MAHAGAPPGASSRWRPTSVRTIPRATPTDTGIPARAKITGIYANSALAKTEAQLNGFDEAIMLDERGHISEGSGENIFVVQDGRLMTPPPSSDILVGITRATDWPLRFYVKDSPWVSR